MFKENSNKGVILWLLSGCFLVYVMVVIGCITRLTHSGLSITDWSFIGSLPPMSEEAWQKPFQQYQASPEYQFINNQMMLDEFKSIFWWEYIHRFVGRLIGVVFILGFGFFLWKKKFQGNMLYKMLLLLFLGGMQGVIGWWMVKSGLVKNPAVSHYRLAIHLISAFTVFAFTFWFALQLIFAGKNIQSEDSGKLRNWIRIFFGVLILQIIFGAFVAGLKAGLFYPTWPKMGGEWFPEDTILSRDTFVENFMENGAGVQWMHRTIALLIVGVLCFIWFRSSKLKLTKQQNFGVSLLIYGVTVQFILGIFTLIYHVPVLLGVLHQTGAFFLFVSTLYLMFQLKRG